MVAMVMAVVHQSLANSLSRLRHSRLTFMYDATQRPINTSHKLVSQGHFTDISQVRLKEQAGVNQPIVPDCLPSSNDSDVTEDVGLVMKSAFLRIAVIITRCITSCSHTQE